MCDLPLIERCLKAAAGLIDLRLFLPEDAAYLPQPLDCGVQVADEVVLKSGKAFLQVPFERQSAGLTTSQQTDAAGDYFRCELFFNIRRTRPELLLLQNRLKNRLVHAIATDRHGQRFLLKNLRASTTQRIDPRLAGKNVVEFVLKSSRLHPPVVLPEVVVALGGWQLPDGSFWLLPDGDRWALPI